MTKKEFKKFYAQQNKLKEEQASEEVELFLETMKEVFSKYPKVVFRNFGTFEVRETKERQIADPRGTGETIHAKPRKYIKFKASKNLEEKLEK